MNMFMKEKMLTYDEAMASPCTACRPCPCCYLLHLDALITMDVMDLDRISFYLNFDNIEICLTADGEWTVYYNYYCQHYDPKKAICHIHDAGQKPGVCAQYNPYRCFYKKLRTIRHHFYREMIWMNRERLDYFMSKILFDEDRNIKDIPGLKKLYKAVTRIPYQSPGKVEAPEEDKSFIGWNQSVMSGTIPSDENETAIKNHLDFRNPCKDCVSYCCQNLLILQQLPATYSSLDYIGYALNFPGIELGISDDQWFIIAKTKCRHFKDNRCSIYKKQERPLLCKYYNAMQCLHKSCFEDAKPEGFIRIRSEEFNWLMETFNFDGKGNIIDGYDVKSLQAHIESKWSEIQDSGPQAEEEIKGANKGIKRKDRKTIASIKPQVRLKEVMGAAKKNSLFLNPIQVKGDSNEKGQKGNRQVMPVANFVVKN
jgi:hypothetical protein